MLGAVSITLSLVTACLGDSIGVSSSPTVEETTFSPSLGVDLTKSVRTANGAYVRDIAPGTGALINPGDSITVKYTGWLSDGTQFDTQTSYATKIGVGHVIPGWDEGVPGMRVGGTRQLLIPPALGYGVYKYGPIPGNSVLVFNVQVLGNP